MTDNMIVALISLAGVIFSALISYIISKKSSDQQTKAIIHKYSDTLFQKRLDAYPSLYKIISKLAKSAKQKNLTKEIIKSTLDDLNTWDSSSILLLGQNNVLLLVKITNNINKILNQQDNDINADEVRKFFIEKTIELERSLKLELGVYSLTDFHNMSLANQNGRDK